MPRPSGPPSVPRDQPRDKEAAPIVVTFDANGRRDAPSAMARPEDVDRLVPFGPEMDFGDRDFFLEERRAESPNWTMPESVVSPNRDDSNRVSEPISSAISEEYVSHRRNHTPSEPSLPPPPAVTPAVRQSGHITPVLARELKSHISRVVPAASSERPRILSASPSLRRVLSYAGMLGTIAAVVALRPDVQLRRRVPAFSAATPQTAAAATGTATFESAPSGAAVSVDGVMRGSTPLRLVLPVGSHVVDIEHGGSSRRLPLAITSNVVTSHYVELASGGSPPALSTGRLEVISQPGGAQVAVDGVPRGMTPLTLETMPPGSHDVVIARGDTSVTHTVRVTAGATATVVASANLSPYEAGWVSIKTPLEMQVFEDGELRGTTAADRIMLSTGAHNLELVEANLAFRMTVSVAVETGKTVTTAVAVPHGTLSINALPWADVWIDGLAVGETPLANLSVPIGSREILWRHPQYGERRRRVAVTPNSPTRVGINFDP
jgi:hypothetical protein